MKISNFASQEPKNISEVNAKDDKTDLINIESIEKENASSERMKSWFTSRYKKYEDVGSKDVDTSLFGGANSIREPSSHEEMPGKMTIEEQKKATASWEKAHGYQPCGSLTVRRLSQIDPCFVGRRDELEIDCVYTFGGIDGPFRPLREALTDSRVTTEQKQRIMKQFSYLSEGKAET